MSIEQPYQGRAVVLDNVTDVQIRIPARRNGFVIAFMLVWLCGWLLGELTALGALGGSEFGPLAGRHQDAPASLFILVWFCSWTVGGLFAIRSLLWLLWGQEVVTVGNGTLTLAKPGLVLHRAKTYDLTQVRHVRVQQNPADTSSYHNRRKGDAGTICFDYGLKTVRFAEDVDEAEARFLVQKLRERRLLLDRNFA